ncbi:MAG TPA: hypothetical protein VFV99_13750 [Kofleriaceae bacterium]|nr:hypothetical protein [Kofleriaceae bacterium]
MRHAFALIVLAACEIQPAPKKQAVPPPPPPAAQVEAPKPVEPPPPNAGSGSALPAPPKLEVTAACLEVGAKVASVFIDTEADPAQRSVKEQERGNMTRKIAEACTVQGWSDEARTCYLGTKTPAEIKACETKFPRPRPTQPPRPPSRVEGNP